MQIWNRIKQNKNLFRYLANKLYKFFNIIERNDIITVPGHEAPYRILDLYDDNSADVLCDTAPSPIRMRTNLRKCKLYQKFFKGEEQFKKGKGSEGFYLPETDAELPTEWKGVKL